MATLDLLTIEEAREAVGLDRDDSEFDLPLAILVAGLSSKLDDEFGPVVVRTITDEEHNGGSDHVILKKRPVSAVSSCTEYDGTTAQVLTVSTNASQPDYAYRLDKAGATGILWRRSGNGRARFPSGLGNVVVTYSAGRFSTTATVDSKWKDAARVMLKVRFTADDFSAASEGEYDVPSQNFPKFAIPNYVRELLSVGQQYQGPVG